MPSLSDEEEKEMLDLETNVYDLRRLLKRKMFLVEDAEDAYDDVYHDLAQAEDDLHQLQKRKANG